MTGDAGPSLTLLEPEGDLLGKAYSWRGGSLIVRGLIVEVGIKIPSMDQQTNVLGRFGQRVRDGRLALGLSQEDFAARCDLDRTYISDIERGKRNVGLRNIDIVARTLAVSIAELMEGV